MRTRHCFGLCLPLLCAELRQPFVRGTLPRVSSVPLFPVPLFSSSLRSLYISKPFPCYSKKNIWRACVCLHSKKNSSPKKKYNHTRAQKETYAADVVIAARDRDPKLSASSCHSLARAPHSLSPSVIYSSVCLQGKLLSRRHFGTL